MKESENKYLNSVAKILAAIEDGRYKSRTAAGIAKQVGLSESDIKKLINTDPNLKKRILVVPGIKKDNKNLYTTIERYKSETPLAVRVLNLINKARVK